MKDFRDYIIKRETEITGVKPDATDLIKISDANHYFNSYQAKQCTINDVVTTLPQDPIVLARYLHEAYEMIAKKQNWNTQENCKVDFSDLPVGNKNTMILLAGKLILDFGGN
jgi:hypothetical protein